MNNKIKSIGIIGAGPAALSFAINYKLLSPETKITIYEKDIFPRHKIGESLLLPVTNELENWGLKEIAEEMFLIKKGASYKWGVNPNKWWDIKFGKNGYSFHVRRSIFDNILANKAIELGIKIYFGKEIKVKTKNNKVINLYDKDDKKYVHDYYIDGSGLNKIIIKKFNKISYIEEDKRIAFYGYLKGMKTIKSGVKRNGISIISFEKGWIWHIPLDDNITSVGIVTTISNSKLYDTKIKFISALKNIPDINNLITDSEIYNEWGIKKLDKPYIIKNWSYTSGITYGENWLAIGDSAYFHDPILSQGVTLAITSGHDAAIALYNNNIKEFFQNYYKEYTSLKKMTDFWYKHNNIKGWSSLSEEIIKNKKDNIYDKEAFAYLTLGELYVENEKKGTYFDASFFDTSRKIIYKNLINKEKN